GNMPEVIDDPSLVKKFMELNTHIEVGGTRYSLKEVGHRGSVGEWLEVGGGYYFSRYNVIVLVLEKIFAFFNHNLPDMYGNPMYMQFVKENYLCFVNKELEIVRIEGPFEGGILFYNGFKDIVLSGGKVCVLRDVSYKY
ncbi:MAG: hypothetical protein ABDH28_02185, partial [Brevinematia bacterium]